MIVSYEQFTRTYALLSKVHLKHALINQETDYILVHIWYNIRDHMILQGHSINTNHTPPKK